MTHAFVTKEFTYASDAHILVRHNTEEIFNPEFCKDIPEQGIYIPSYVLKMIPQSKVIRLLLISGATQIRLLRKDYSLIFDLPKIDDMGKYPDADKLLDSDDPVKPLKEIALNPTLLHNLIQAMGHNGTVRMKFKGADKNIICSPNTDACDYPSVKALIMPCLIND
jgi:hypothetical protein